MNAPVQVGVRLNDFVGGVVHAGVARDIEVAFQDHLIGGGGSGRDPQIPKGSRPDLAVCVDPTGQIGGVGLGPVNSAKARGRTRTVGGGIPIGDACRIG